MDDLQKLHLILTVSSLVAGVSAACFVHRLPAHGWIGAVLVLIAAFGWMLVEPNDSAHASRLAASMTFLFFAPVAIVYSLRAKRRAPDRIIALAAFVGALILSVCFLMVSGGLVFLIYTMLAHPE